MIFYCHIQNTHCSKHIDSHALLRLSFNNRHMLICGCMVDGVDLITLHQLTDGVSVIHRTEKGYINLFFQITLGKFYCQLFCQFVEIFFAMIYGNQFIRPLINNLPAKLRADGSASTGNHHNFPCHTLAQQLKIWWYDTSAQDITDRYISYLLQFRSARYQFRVGWNCLYRRTGSPDTLNLFFVFGRG